MDKEICLKCLDLKNKIFLKWKKKKMFKNEYYIVTQSKKVIIMEYDCKMKEMKEIIFEREGILVKRKNKMRKEIHFFIFNI